MPVAIFLITRLLMITSLIFIIGYVFGNFSKSVRLTKITRVALIFILVSFVIANIIFFRSNRGWRYSNFHHSDRFENCYLQKDSAIGH